MEASDLKSGIPYDGIRITTLSCDPAEIRVETAHSGDGNLFVEILDGDPVVASGEGNDLVLRVPNARLWDAETPYLYTCRVSLKNGENILDTAETRFGIRSISWSTLAVRDRAGCRLLSARPECSRRLSG